MAATGFTPIQLYRTTTASAVPTAGNLADGELAINLTDEKLYFKNAAGTVKLLASNASSGGTVSSVDVSGGTTGLTTSGGPVTSSGTITLAGTLGAANGGTGLTSLTAGYIPFGNGTSAFGSSANLFWDSANNRLGVGTSNPQVSFHVAGTSLASSRVYIESSSGTGSQQPSLNLYRSSTTSMGGQFIGSINFIRALTDGSIPQAASIYASGSNSSSSPTGSLTYNPITAHRFQIANVTKMEMDVNGLLGVGVTPVANNGVLQLGSYGSVQALMEKATVSATAATGTIDYDAATQAVLYYTTNSSGNWTINIRGSSTLTLNSMMQIGQSLTLAFLATNGATAYYQSALTIDGSSVTPKWQGGTAPTAGNASSIDAYVLTVIKTGSATFTVLASQTKFA